MTTTNQQGAIAKTAGGAVSKKKTPQTLKDYVTVMMPEIEKALPRVMTPERFQRIVLSALSSTPALASCTKESFLGAMMNAAQLGLEPNTPLGQAYLIPYGGKCQFQIGYKGLIDLAYRSGEVKVIQAHEVCENDVIEFEYGLDPVLKHKPAKTNRGKVTWYYAVVKLNNGGYGFEVMSKEEVEKFGKKYSKSYNNGPWQTAFDEMAKKTVLKKVLKYMPLKSDLVREIEEDETIKTTISNDMSEVPNEYFDAEYDETVVDPVTGEVTETPEPKQDLDGNPSLL